MKPQLVVMLKVPRAGRVKTRLAADIGNVDATWWYRHNVRRLLRRIESPLWDLTLAVSPDVEGLTRPFWPSHLPRVAQGRGDLGARMSRLFSKFSPAPTCIIGSDIPAASPHHIRSCFAALGSSSGVLGPSGDGGYWLIGLRNSRPLSPSTLQDVRWSTEHAMDDTMASARDVDWALGPTLEDVDTLADLQKIAGR